MKHNLTRPCDACGRTFSVNANGSLRKHPCRPAVETPRRDVRGEGAE